MKAAVLIQTGEIQNLEKNLIIKNISEPVISPDEVLIKVNNASVNHRDVWISEGKYSSINLPVILGSDASGIIAETGSNVRNFSPGDEVIINPGISWGDDEDFQGREFNILGLPSQGTFAEYIKVSPKYILNKPAHLTFEEAASIPLAAVTAYRALFKKAKIKSGENILITGAGGGVSVFSILFAVKAGLNVYVTSGSEIKIKKAVSIGAVGGVNYNDKDWTEKISGMTGKNINVIIDSAGGVSFSKYIDIIDYGGRIISYGSGHGNANNINLHKLYWKQLKIYGSVMGSDNDFKEMTEFIEKNKLHPVIHKIYPFEEICSSFRDMKTSQQFGKLVIRL